VTDNSSAAAARPCRDKTAYKSVEIGFVDLHELAALQRIDAGLELRTQRFRSERTSSWRC